MTAVRFTLIASGVVGILFGLLFLLGADTAIQGFNLGAPTIPAVIFARSEGASLISIGIINLLASNDRGSAALRALLVGNILIHVLSVAVDFSATYERNGGVYFGLVVHIIFIIAFAYLLINWRRLTNL